MLAEIPFWFFIKFVPTKTKMLAHWCLKRTKDSPPITVWRVGMILFHRKLVIVWVHIPLEFVEVCDLSLNKMIEKVTFDS